MATYTVLTEQGDSAYIFTIVGNDGTERIVGEEVGYTSVHGPGAAIGSEWQFAVIGEDEYNPLVAQVWVPSIDGCGDPFNPSDYLVVKEGRKPFPSLS